MSFLASKNINSPELPDPRLRGDDRRRDYPLRPRKRAFFGVRACELAAIRIQDEVLLGQVYQDPDYAARRQACLLIAVVRAVRR